MEQRAIPVDIKVDLKQREVKIQWQDNHESAYTLDFLRKYCPCAVCNQLRQEAEENPLRVLSSDQAEAKGELDSQNPVQKVGQYALQFFWVDGHRTGIYSYNYLRQLG